MTRTICLTLLAAFMFGCASGQDPAYVTKHGIWVFAEELNVPEQEDVERWSSQTVDFWHLPYPASSRCFWLSVSRTNAHFVNLDHVSDGTEIFAGLEYGYDIWISSGTPAKVRGVFIHELSHVLAGRCLGLPGNDESHAEFGRAGLDSLARY